MTTACGRGRVTNETQNYIETNINAAKETSQRGFISTNSFSIIFRVQIPQTELSCGSQSTSLFPIFGGAISLFTTLHG